MFDLEKNYKYGYNENDGHHFGGNMFLNLIKQSNVKRRFNKRNRMRYRSHRIFKSKLHIEAIQRFKRFKSCDNIKNNNDDNDSFYIPSIYNKNNIEENPIRNPKKNKSKKVPAKISNKMFNFNDIQSKVFGDSLFNRTIKGKKINFPINNLKNNKTSRKKINKDEEGNELKNFLISYKPKDNKNSKKDINKKLNNKNKSTENKGKKTDKEDTKEKSNNKNINYNATRIRSTSLWSTWI